VNTNIGFYFRQDFLESCRAPTLLAELDDDDIPDEEDNDDDENEDDDDYGEVMVSTNLLSFMVTLDNKLFSPARVTGFNNSNGSWDTEFTS
jgi:E3 ubiquitin-protein ligase HECTD1